MRTCENPFAIAQGQLLITTDSYLILCLYKSIYIHVPLCTDVGVNDIGTYLLVHCLFVGFTLDSLYFLCLMIHLTSICIGCKKLQYLFGW